MVRRQSCIATRTDSCVAVPKGRADTALHIQRGTFGWVQVTELSRTTKMTPTTSRSPMRMRMVMVVPAHDVDSTAVSDLLFLTRKTCALCTEAYQSCSPRPSGSSHTVEVIDVDDAALVDRFGDRVPVVLRDGVEVLAGWFGSRDDSHAALTLPAGSAAYIAHDGEQAGFPPVTVQRLPIYLRCLEGLPTGQHLVSSDELADAAGVPSTKIRKDPRISAPTAPRGGYDVEHLKHGSRMELGLTVVGPVVIVGIRNLSRALANYGEFEERRFQVIGLFDS